MPRCGRHFPSIGRTLFNGTFTGGAVTVASGATLSGSGTLGTLAGNSISASGTVAPGDLGTISTLHLALNTGDKLGFASGSTLAFDVGSSTSDQIAFGTAGDWLSGSGDLTLALSGTINYEPRSADTKLPITGNEHFLVEKLADRALIAVWTQSSFEGMPD